MMTSQINCMSHLIYEHSYRFLSVEDFNAALAKMIEPKILES